MAGIMKCGMAMGRVEIAICMKGTYTKNKPTPNSNKNDKLPHMLFRPCSVKDRYLVLLMIWFAT